LSISQNKSDQNGTNLEVLKWTIFMGSRGKYYSKLGIVKIARNLSSYNKKLHIIKINFN